MLVTPQATKRTLSSVSFDSMVIKAARSAENVNSTTVQVSNGLKGHHDNSIIRKESSSSLQIPGLLRRTNSDSAKSDDTNSKKVRYTPLKLSSDLILTCKTTIENKLKLLKESLI